VDPQWRKTAKKLEKKKRKNRTEKKTARHENWGHHTTSLIKQQTTSYQSASYQSASYHISILSASLTSRQRRKKILEVIIPSSCLLDVD